MMVIVRLQKYQCRTILEENHERHCVFSQNRRRKDNHCVSESTLGTDYQGIYLKLPFLALGWSF